MEIGYTNQSLSLMELWKSARAASCLPRERDALLDFKRYAFDPHPHPAAAAQFWLSSLTANPFLEDCCTWKGVSCDAHAMVTDVDLNGCGILDDTVDELRAQLNSEALRALAAIHRISSLDFSCQGFHGSIASEIGNLTSLTQLRLSHNNMSGRLPPSMRFLNSLQVLDLGKNQFSPQEVPSFGFELPSLRSLDLSFNSFTGALPDSFANLTSLWLPDLSSNNFSGAIPDVFANLKHLVSLNLSGNQLDGEIPATLGNLTNLLLLDLSSNELQGHIPDSFNGLNHFEVVNVSSNHLTGRITSGTQWDTFNISSFLDNDGLCAANANREEGLPTCASRPMPR